MDICVLCGSNLNLSTCVNPDLYWAFKLKSVPLNQYTGKTDYFQLTIIGPNGGLCPCFPTNETSDFYWQYLPDKAAAEAAAAANAALQQQPATALTQIVHSPPVTPAKIPATGVCAGCARSQNIAYGTKGQPGSG